MTDTTTRSSQAVDVRPHGIATIGGGLIAVALGLIAAVDPSVGAWWFAVAGLMTFLLVAGIAGMRATVEGNGVARTALLVAVAAFVLFGLAHFYTLLDEDTAVVLFSIFMIIGAVGLAVAGVAMLRARAGRRLEGRVTLLTGLWPVATIPAGAAIGDVPHFLAIALWGGCWVAFGAALVTRSR